MGKVIKFGCFSEEYYDNRRYEAKEERTRL